MAKVSDLVKIVEAMPDYGSIITLSCSRDRTREEVDETLRACAEWMNQARYALIGIVHEPEVKDDRILPSYRRTG